jgi:Uma2 family endonuclease
MLASATLVPEDEYLRTTYKPACDYIDGVLRQKSMPTYKHGRAQGRIVTLINSLSAGFEAIGELTCWVRSGKYLVPDVVVQRIHEIQDPYPVRPVHLCVEILSPEDRFSDTVSKCAEYHAWGVEYCWMIDPEDKVCWEYHSGQRPSPVPGDGRISAGPLSLNTAEIFG